MGNVSLRVWLRLQSAKLLTFLGNRASAQAQLRLAVEEQPSFQAAWRYLAYLLSASGQQVPALEAFRHAVRLDPTDAVTRFNHGFLLQELGRGDEAAAEFEEVTRLAPAIDRAWYGLGVILLEQRRFLAAAEKLERAAKLQYFNPHAGHQLARAYHALGERDKALAEYQRVKSYDPKVAAQMAVELGLG